MIIVQNYIQSAKVLKKIEIKEGKSKIIRYFCIVKRFKYNFRCIFAVLLIILTTKASAQQTEAPQWVDSVDISLLTCGPGQEVWSYYGHTALRIEDRAHGSDVAVNWGMFSFNQDFFVLRFVFGLTDYQIGIIPMERFMAEYSYEGRWVRQQRLALTRNEKWNILTAIEKNNREENRTYRYNFFYDNCTTRARNMIIDHLATNCTDFEIKTTLSTYREEIHRLNAHHRWARFGNDLLLGYRADRAINKQEWEFLPDNLSMDFEVEARQDTAQQQVSSSNVYPQKPRYIKLVDSTFYLIPPKTVVMAADADKENSQTGTTIADVITPFVAATGILVIVFLLSLAEWRRKKNFWWIDTALLVLTGLPGLILLAMVFSQHPTVQINFQTLILNPLNLIFVWSVTKKMRQRRVHWYYSVWAGLIVVSLFLQIWQDYAEGMVILALSLLMRYAVKSTQLDLRRKSTSRRKIINTKPTKLHNKKNRMVNRYITALLVVLAATGMEAQTYQQALRFALTDISYDEFIQQPEAKALEDDILSVIKAIKEASEDHQKAQHHFPSAIQKADASAILTESNPYICFTPPTEPKYQAPYGSIVIRGPDF